MANLWVFKSAHRKGKDVTVVLERAAPTEDDPNGVELKELTWGRGDMTWATFRAMVLQEVVAHLADMNTAVAEQELDSELNPV